MQKRSCHERSSKRSCREYTRLCTANHSVEDIEDTLLPRVLIYQAHTLPLSVGLQWGSVWEVLEDNPHPKPGLRAVSLGLLYSFLQQLTIDAKRKRRRKAKPRQSVLTTFSVTVTNTCHKGDRLYFSSTPRGSPEALCFWSTVR